MAIKGYARVSTDGHDAQKASLAVYPSPPPITPPIAEATRPAPAAPDLDCYTQ
jgi:hypothetical protein